jgi:hypothetical protein
VVLADWPLVQLIAPRELELPSHTARHSVEPGTRIETRLKRIKNKTDNYETNLD